MTQITPTDFLSNETQHIDDNLARRMREGDETALAMFISRWQACIRKRVSRDMVDYSLEDREEVVNDVWSSVWKCVCTWDTEKEFVKYFAGVLRCTIATARKRIYYERSKKRKVQEHQQQIFRTQTEIVVDDDLKHDLYNAIAQLDDPLRLVVLLKMKGYTQDDIKDAFGLGRGAVYGRFKVAKNQLRDLLAEYE